MKSRFYLKASTLVFLLGAGIAAASPPESVLLSIRGIDGTKLPVGFSHKGHMETVNECRTCHHRDAAIVGQKCSGCHGPTDEITMVCLRQAFHRQCLGCHSRLSKGPRKCSQCHTGEHPSLAHAGP